MGRPKKHPSDTARGQREIKREAKLALRAEKARKLAEKRRLSGLGLCVTPDGDVTSNSQAGRQYGEKGKESGHQGKAFGAMGAVAGVKGGVAGAQAWVGASPEEKAARKEAGVKAWEGASSEEKAARKEAGNTRGR